jgi:tetratricopeptide (TPR) repeat protein
MRLGNIEFRSGSLKDAIVQFQRGVDLAPDNALGLLNLGIANMQSDNLAEARKDLEAALKIETNSRTYAALGSVLLLEGKYDDAAEMDQKAIKLNPSDYEAWGNLGAAYDWSGTQHEKAVQAFRKAIDLGEMEHQKNRQDPVLLIALADFYASVDDSVKSLTLIRQALVLAPEDSQVEYRAGEVYETLGQRASAIPLIAKAVASGYRAYEFQRNPELAALRADPAFVKELNAEKQRKK